MMIKAATIYDGVRGGMICIGHLVVEPGEVPANDSETIEVELEGARVGDIILLTPPNDFAGGGLVFTGATVTDEDEVSVTIENVTGTGITGGELHWNALILKRSTPGGCETEEDES